MTLLELSVQYQASAEALSGRLRELEARKAGCAEEWEQAVLAERMRTLAAMWRQARELAVLTAHYYERGYRRDGKYTL